MTGNRDDHGFEGSWRRYPPPRNALLSELIAEYAENIFCWPASARRDGAESA